MDKIKVHNIISLLVDVSISKDGKIKSVEHIKKNVEKALELIPSSDEVIKINQNSNVTTKFVLISLYVLKMLSQFSDQDSNLNSNLLSVQQQQKIKTLLQFIFSLGLTPSLFEGVNTSLKNKTFQLFLLTLEDLTLTESYLLMCKILRSLCEILTTSNLRSIVLSHLGDLLSGLLQIIYKGEFKKPVKNITKNNSNNIKESTFIMTEEWYQQLIKDREEFKGIYKELLENTYKPLVIKELFLLLAPTKSIENNKIISPPFWLKKAISNQLTEYLTGPNGVFLIMRAMCESSLNAIDWKKTEGIARLISTPHSNFTDDTFYAIISPQIITMLSLNGSYYMPVAKSCIKNIYHHNIDACNKYIFEKLFEPLLLCAKPISENFNGILIDENCLSQCIDLLSKCFLPRSENLYIPLKILRKVIKILFLLYMKVAKSPYEHKAAVQDLLIEFFYSVKNIENLKIIYNTLIFKEHFEEMLEMNENLEFQFGCSAGVQVGKCQNNCLNFSLTEFKLEFEEAGDHMLDLLSQRQEYSKKLLTDLFIILLSSLSNFQDNKIDAPSSSVDLLDAEELIIFLFRTSQKRIITIKLLAVLSENIHVMATIQENPCIVFKFVYDLLKLKASELIQCKELNGGQNLENGKKDFSKVMHSDDVEEIFVALAVVDLITVNIHSNSENWEVCKSLVDILEIIRKYSEDNNVRYFSDLLFKRIITLGSMPGTKKAINKSALYEKVFNLNTDIKQSSKENLNHFQYSISEKQEKEKNLIPQIDKNVELKNEVDIIFEEICSDDIPTRGHAIIQLEKLIKRRDITIVSKKDYIFSILKCNLQHKDTYVYLSAINALETLANIQKADKIVETLCEEFTKHKKELNEIQMKIGEVLMRIIRGLGEITPKYKSLLVNTFLIGTKSSNELLRASSLSNLAELLKILGYSVGNILEEVFVCVKAIALTDKSEIARRAAVMVALFLLKGINSNSFIILKSVIQGLYKTLLHIYKTEQDEVTRLHADLALAEIDRLVKSSIDKTLKLEKHIGILDLHKENSW